MRFEFDYDIETDQITIIYDGVFSLSASYDGTEITFTNFERINDDLVESALKNLCRSMFNALG